MAGGTGPRGRLQRSADQARREHAERERHRRIADPRRRLAAAAATGLGYGLTAAIPLGRLPHGRTALGLGGAVAALIGCGGVVQAVWGAEASVGQRVRGALAGVGTGAGIGAVMGASTWCSLRSDAWLERTAARLGTTRPRVWIGALAGLLTAALDYAERTPPHEPADGVSAPVHTVSAGAGPAGATPVGTT